MELHCLMCFSTLESPEKCLSECYKALSFGGIIIFSGPKAGIPLNRIFDQTADLLRKENLWKSLRDKYEVVRQRNTYLDQSKILKQYSVNEIKNMTEAAGFTIDSLDENGYTGDDIIVIASKR